MNPFSTRVVAEFYFSKNQVAGDADDVKILEMRATAVNDGTFVVKKQSKQPAFMTDGILPADLDGYLYTSEQSQVFQNSEYSTNLFIPANLSGNYYLYQRVSFEDTGITDAEPTNNVSFSPEQIYVRPQAAAGMNYAPANLPNQRLMFVNTASTLGSAGTGSSLATFLNGTFSIPYRSSQFPAESGTITYAKTAGSSAQVTVSTTSGSLAGLQRILNLAYDSPNTGTFAYSATMGGHPADSGSGFFYEVTPITNQVSLRMGPVFNPNVIELFVTNAAVLRWSGGAPPFAVEYNADCTRNDQWQAAQRSDANDPATNLVFQTFALSPTNQMGFYRVRGR